jgi:hypothetical protein
MTLTYSEPKQLAEPVLIFFSSREAERHFFFFYLTGCSESAGVFSAPLLLLVITAFGFFVRTIPAPTVSKPTITCLKNKKNGKH